MRKLIQFLRAAAAENHIIGNKRFLQQHDGTEDFAFPLLFAELFQSRLAEVILDDVVVTIREIREPEWEHVAFPNQRRSKSGAQYKKQHPPTTITAERLHRGVIDNADRFAQRLLKIESCPARPKMLRLGHDTAIADRGREPH